MIVQGEASHSANLTEWQNSSETVLARVAPDGIISGVNFIAPTGTLTVKSILFDDDKIRLGNHAGTDEGAHAVHIGEYAGFGQGTAASNVNIGYAAGYQHGGGYSISIGHTAGYQMDNGAAFNISLGYQAGKYCESDYGIYVGYRAGHGIDGDTDGNARRVCIGGDTLYDAHEQDNTIAIGHFAGRYAPSGYQNVYIGYYAGGFASDANRTSSNWTTMYGNVAIGTSAFYAPFSEAADKTCVWNTVVGYEAGYNADDNGDLKFATFLGARAGYNCEQAYGNIAIGLDAFRNGEGSYACNVGYQAGKDTTNQTYGVGIGYRAAYSSAGHNYSVGIGYRALADCARAYYTIAIGREAGHNADSDYSIFLGKFAGAYCVGDYNIEFVLNGASTSILDDYSNKIHIQNTIVGDTSAKKLAIGNVGVGDVVPDATVEIKPNATTDVGLIVQGASSQSANLTEWQDSSENVLAYVDKNGIMSGTAVKAGLKTQFHSSYITFDLNTSNSFQVVLGGTPSLTISNESPGQRFLVRFVQDGTGSRTVNWFSTIKWAGGSAPTLTTTADKADVFEFLCTATDAYDGFVVGQNI